MSHQEDKKGLSRRNFMAIAGGAAGLAAMTAMGISTMGGEYQANIREIDIANTR